MSFAPARNRRFIRDANTGCASVGLAPTRRITSAWSTERKSWVPAEVPNVVFKPKPVGAIMIRGSEGIAVQLARCCRPIPGDPIIGCIRKGQGLEVHTHDCPSVSRLRGDRGRWVDVDWEPAGDDRLFDVAIRVLTSNARGALARIAGAIAEEDCNIQSVSMDGEQGAYPALNLTVQVRDRMHLARLMRSVRRIPEVQRIGRVKGDGRVG